MEDRRTDSGSGAAETPEPIDPRGEELVNPELADPGEYVVADDETDAEELTDAAVDDVTVTDPEQLAEAEDDAREADGTAPTLAAHVRSARPTRKSAPVKKDAPTPSRRGAGTTVEKRTSPAQFVRQSIDELRKVVWPTGSQVRQYFLVVLVFVLFVMTYVTLLDTGIGALLLKIFG